MSKQVEERVVSMEFDNKDFEKNIKTSMSSLDRFKEKIQAFKTSANDLAYFGQVVGSITFNKIQQGAEMSIGKVMQLAAALTGVVNITDQLYRTVTSTFKSLSVDQVTRGWSKYEEKTEAVQTIMASTRKETESEAEAMARVNEQIERLNWFTDETSYNLTDMVNNIGKFTSVGVELNDAVTAMEGIALAAAQAGVKTNDASRAMYNFSQAMAVGALERIDYKTINQMGMSTVQFKKQAMEAAEAAGTLKKIKDGVYETIKIADNESSKAGIKVDISTFEDTLRYDWMNKEAMMGLFKYYGEFAEYVRDAQKADETVQETIARLKESGEYAKFGLSAEAFEHGQEAKTLTEAFDAAKDAASTKWMQAYEAVFGNYLEAKKLWTDLSQTLWEVFARPAEAVQEILYSWKKMQGRTKFLNAITIIWENFYSVLERIKNTFFHIFPNGDQVAEGLNNLTVKLLALARSFEKFVKNIQNNTDLWANIRIFIQGLKDGMDILIELGKQIWDHVINPFLNKSEDMVLSFSDILAKIGEFITNLKNTIEETDAFNKAFTTIEDVVTRVIDGFSKLNDALYKTFGDKIFQKVSIDSENIADSFDNVGNAIGGLVDKIFDGLVNAIPYVEKALSWVGALFKSTGDIIKGIWTTYVSPVLKGIGGFIAEGIKALLVDEKETDSLKNINGSILNTIGNLFEKIGAWCKGWGMDALNWIRDWLIKAMEWLTPLNEAFAHMLGFENQVELSNKVFDSILLVARSIYTIVSTFKKIKALKKIDDFSISGLLIGFDATAFKEQLNVIASIPKQISSNLTGMVSDINKTFKYKALLDGLAKVLLSFGASFLMIAASMKLISSISDDEFKRAAAVIVTILSVLMVIFVLLLGQKGEEGSKFDPGTGVIPATLTNNLQLVSKFGTFTSGEIKSDFEHVSKKLKAMAAMLLSFGASVLLIAVAMKTISTIETPDRAVASLLAVMAIMTDLVIFSKNLDTSNSKQLVILSGAFVLLSIAIGIIASAIHKMGKLKPENLALAMLVLDDVFLMFGAMVAVSETFGKGIYTSDNFLSIAAAMLLISLSILGIAGSLKLMSKIPVNDMDKCIKVLGKIAIGIGALMLVGGIVGKYSNSAGSVAASSLAILAMVAPILALAGAFYIIKDIDPTTLESAGNAFATVLVAIGGAMALMSKAFEDPKIGGIAALVLVALSASLWALAPALEAFSAVDPKAIIAVALAIGIAVAALAGINYLLSKKGGTGSAEMLKFAGAILMIGGAIALIGAGIFLVAAGFETVVQALIEISNIGPDAVDSLVEVISSIILIFPLIGIKLGEMLGSMIVSMLQKVADKEELATSIATLAKKFLEAAKKALPYLKEFLEHVIVFLRDFIPNLNDFLYEVTDNLFGYILDLLNKYVPQLNTHLTNATEDLLLKVIAVLDRVVPVLNKHLAHVTNNLIYWVNEVIKYLSLTIIQGTIQILKDIRDHISEIVALTIEIGVMATMGIIQGITESIPMLLDKGAELIETLVDELDRVLEEHEPKLEETITKIGDLVLKGLDAWVTAETAVNGAIYNVAKHLVNGLAESTLKAAYEGRLTTRIGQFLGNSIVEGLMSREGLDEHSNSKKTIAIGKYATGGLLEGLESGKEKVLQAGKDIGNMVANSFTDHFGSPEDIINNTIDKIVTGAKETFGSFDFGSIVDDFIDLNPTITPELDLTKVKGEAKNLEGIFNKENIEGINSTGLFSKPLNGLDSVSYNDATNKLMDKMQTYMDIQSYNNAGNTTNINVTLDGDAKKMLKVLNIENIKQSKATGFNKLAEA